MSHFPPPPPISRSHSSPLFLSALGSQSPLLSPFFHPFHPKPPRLRHRTKLARRIWRAHSSLSLLLPLQYAPPPSSTPVLLPPFSFSPLFLPSRVSSARLAARNPSLHFLISSFLMRHRSAHCAHPWAFRCRSLLSQLWLRLRRSLLFSLAALTSRLRSEN